MYTWYVFIGRGTVCISTTYTYLKVLRSARYLLHVISLDCPTHDTLTRNPRAHNTELCSEHFDMFSFLLHTHCYHKFKIEIGGAHWNSSQRPYACPACSSKVHTLECCCICCTFRALVCNVVIPAGLLRWVRWIRWVLCVCICWGMEWKLRVYR